MAWVRLATSSLLNRLLTWRLTVSRVMTSCLAIAWLDRQAGLLEGLHQPGEIVPRHGGGRRWALLAPARQQLAHQGGHRRALVDEHPQVALGRGQRKRLGQRGQGAGLVALACRIRARVARVVTSGRP
jgi:hypothetical protein